MPINAIPVPFPHDTHCALSQHAGFQAWVDSAGVGIGRYREQIEAQAISFPSPIIRLANHGWIKVRLTHYLKRSIPIFRNIEVIEQYFGRLYPDWTVPETDLSPDVSAHDAEIILIVNCAVEPVMSTRAKSVFAQARCPLAQSVLIIALVSVLNIVDSGARKDITPCFAEVLGSMLSGGHVSRCDGRYDRTSCV